MKYIISIGALVALCAGRAAWAHGEANLESKFKQMDTNNDGSVSRDEYTNFYRQKFSSMNTNHDGYLTLDELQAGHPAKTGEKAFSAAEELKKFDTDGDGKLSESEYLAGKQAMFDQLDKDKTGSLTKEEFISGIQQMKK
jgi:Ca2+-binding EF-hand superfamily protein